MRPLKRCSNISEVVNNTAAFNSIIAFCLPYIKRDLPDFIDFPKDYKWDYDRIFPQLELLRKSLFKSSIVKVKSKSEWKWIEKVGQYFKVRITYEWLSYAKYSIIYFPKVHDESPPSKDVGFGIF